MDEGAVQGSVVPPKLEEKLEKFLGPPVSVLESHSCQTKFRGPSMAPETYLCVHDLLDRESRGLKVAA